jgi:P2 family phage contractile tail tube protein
MLGRAKEIDFSTVKAGEGESESTFALDYLRKIVDDIDMYEVDIPNYLFVVGGVDVYAPVRAALGL